MEWKWGDANFCQKIIIIQAKRIIQGIINYSIIRKFKTMLKKRCESKIRDYKNGFIYFVYTCLVLKAWLLVKPRQL